MKTKSIHENVKQVLAIIPQALGNGTTFASAKIDTKGYNGVEFVVNYGSITTTGTALTAVVKEGDTTGAMTSVADRDLVGTEALVGLAAATPRTAGTTKEVAKRIGYKGNKRYVDLTITRAGTTSVGCIAATALLVNPEAAPVSNP